MVYPAGIDYSAILNGSAGVSGIQSAVQGRAASRLLHRRLDAVLSPGSRAGPLALTRVKYKPGRRLSAYYTTSVSGQAGLEARAVPFVITWGGEASADPDQARLLEDEAGRRGLLAPFRRLQDSGAGAEQGSLLQVWPLDPDFPQLPRLGDPAYAPQLFGSAGLDFPPLPPGCVTVAPVRYRPGERHVLRLRLDLPDGPRRDNDPRRETLPRRESFPRVLYAKLYHGAEPAGRAARIVNRAADWLDGSLRGFHAVRPVGVALDDGVILYPHAAGRPLSRQLRRSPAWLAGQLRLVGAVLAALHGGPESLAEDLEEATLEKEVKVIRRASEHVQVLLPEAGRRILDLLERAQAAYARLPQEKPVFTHSDFKADHLLVGREGMALIDFDTCALADPALDIGKFLADLDWWFAVTRAPGVDLAQRAFLEGYPGPNRDGRLARARVFHALILVKIAIRRTRLYWKDWDAITTQMVERAEHILTGAEEI